MARRRGAGRGVVIRFYCGAYRGPVVPLARPPSETEDLAAFVARMARHAGWISWDHAIVTFPDGEKRTVRRPGGES